MLHPSLKTGIPHRDTILPGEAKMSRKLPVVFACSIGLVFVLLFLPSRLIRPGTASALPISSTPPRHNLTFDSPLSPAVTSVITSSDDRENTVPTGWWVLSGQTVADITNFINTNNARIVDIYLEAVTTPRRFTVTFVSNTGAYSKGWWWYVDVDEPTLSAAITANNGRLISLKAYDIGSGQIRFTAVMISNTGTDAKTWWWYYNKTTAELTNLWQANIARLVQVNSYVTGGQTKYAAVMISDTGADDRTWYWYVNASVGDIVTHINDNQARLIDLDRDPTTGNYNVIMNACTTNCPLWWWYVGSTGQQLLDNSAQNGARNIDTNSYPGCGGTCYSYLMINNSNDITTRVGQLLRNGTDGTKGLYLKEVNGPVLANLEDGWVFEPASTIKAVLHVFAMHQVQNGLTQLTNNVITYVPPVSGSCPGNTPNGFESLSTALGEMMRHSDNTRTREISDTFGVNNIIGYAQSFGMAHTHINHIIGCGGPIPNQTTLDDLGTLYEKVANGTLLTPTNRSTFYSLMAGKAEYQLEGYDWTGLWSTDIPKIIYQEAPPGMSGVLTRTFQNQMNLAYKAGNYKICGATCATYVDHISIAGWAQIPFCSGGAFTSKQYVFGLFINNSTSDATSSATFNATKSELLREQIRAGLASCSNFHQVYLPLTLK
jgi:hypothetical protein